MRTCLIVAAMIIASAVFALQPRAATTNVFTQEQEDAIGSIIRSYLLNNPELFEEVIEELQKKREAEAAVARREHLRELYRPDSKYARFAMGEGDIVVVEFMDYNCPFCRKAYSVMRDIYESADIQVRFVELPVISPMSVPASQAAIAAEKQDKYVEFHDAMMRLEDRITNEDTIFRVAEEVGLDIDQLKQDMDAPDTKALIEENLALADALGVQGTPAIFVGDNTYIAGAPEGLRDELLEAIAAARRDCMTC